MSQPPALALARPALLSATTVAAQSAGLRLRTLEDLVEGQAASHDFTNEFLLEMGLQVRGCAPEEAGANLARLAPRHDFTLYEHFITDRIGREQNFEMARNHMPSLTNFIRAVLEASDLSSQAVILTRDHGNIEDLRTRSHTLNPVATIATGPASEFIAARVRSLTDITPTIVNSISNTLL